MVNALRATVSIVGFILVLANASPQSRRISEVGQAANISEQKGFDVVSVRLSDPEARSFDIRPTMQSLTVHGAPLRFLIEYAYDIHDFQLEGAPRWVDDTRFDISAKMDPGAPVVADATVPQVEIVRRITAERLRTLLAERFNLTIRHGIKEGQVYHLVTDKGGPRITPASQNQGYSAAPGYVKCTYFSIADFAAILSGLLDRSVLDETHISGNYAFTLQWEPDDSKLTESTHPDIFTALKEQLGLKLVPAKGDVDAIYIEHIDRPTAN